MKTFTAWLQNKLNEVDQVNPTQQKVPIDSQFMDPTGPSGGAFVGMDVTGPNPFMDPDTGTITDLRKYQAWELQRAGVKNRRDNAAKQQPADNLVNKDDYVQTERGTWVNKVDAAWEAFEKLFQKYFDAFAANKIMDPFNQHPGFRKQVFEQIFRKFNLNNAQAKQIIDWYTNGKATALGTGHNLKYLQMKIQGGGEAKMPQQQPTMPPPVPPAPEPKKSWWQNLFGG